MSHRIIVTGRNSEISATPFQDEAKPSGLLRVDGERNVSAMRTARVTVQFLASIKRALDKAEAGQ